MDLLSIFSKYDVTCEYMMLALSIIYIFIMGVTRPVRTRMLKLNKVGFVTCIVTIIVHLHLLKSTCRPLNNFSPLEFKIEYILYVLLYLTILNEITVYIDLLSYQKRNNIKKIVIKVMIMSICFMSLLLYPLFTNKIYTINDSGNITITKWIYIFEVCGILCALCNFISTLIRKKTVSRIVAAGTLLFIPLDAIVLVIQYWFDTAYFISFTYVIPFAVFYTIFHASIFDDIIGCQSTEAILTQIDTAIYRKKSYVAINISFPQLKNREISDLRASVEQISSIICRKIERIKKGGRIYASNIYTYSYFAFVKDEDEAKYIADQIFELLSTPYYYEGTGYKACFKEVMIMSNPLITKASQVSSMISYLKRQLSEDLINEYKYAEEDDYIKFLQYSEIEQTLMDIRSSNTLDDERVLCYIQPIYDIDSGQFMTGEALMRMKINGNMVFPDSFIPVAEHINCIHNLTLIMINNICKIIKKLETEYYNFNGITVNISTKELSDPDFYKDILKISYDNQIDPAHLRLEITESISVTNYDTVLSNMVELQKHGILFYLDDFGTGYSNLERLSKFPFQTIKFDKSLLYTALENDRSDSLMRLHIKHFEKSGLKTVVEGVEDEAMFNYCKEVGFDMIQGYYFAKPQPAENITEYFMN